MMNIESFLGEWSSHGPAPSDPRTILPTEVATALPSDYLEFMRKNDGGEGFIGSNYLILWRLKELVAFNRDYQVETYVPGLLLIGSSGGGEAFGYDTRLQEWPVVMVPFIGMRWEDVITVGNNLNDLFKALFGDKLYG